MPDPLPGKVNVLLIGGGGREHALARRIRCSPRCGELFATHIDNPGIAALASPVDVPVSIREIYRLQQFCDRRRIGLVVIGPEEPLAEGYADRLTGPGRRVFGPTAEAARLESDKAWSKQLMRGASIPTAEARIFTDPEQAKNYIESREADDPILRELLDTAAAIRDPAERRRLITQKVKADSALSRLYTQKRPDVPVIKAAGLAKGKGVVIASTLAEALDAVDRIMVKRIFGEAGARIVVEDHLTGLEVSVLCIVDGRNILVLPPCQDHKRLRDNDEGPNTGGMGAFCPSSLIDGETMEIVEREILVPTLDALRREEIDYRGVLYAGLMLTPAGPRALEFNVRFGDPECQALMARLKSDAVDLMLAAAEGRLDEINVEWDPRASCCVVLAAEGYPDAPKANAPIKGVEDAASMPDVFVDLAGCKRAPDGGLVTSGGRVLAVTALGDDLPTARERAYAAASRISFPGMHLRRDIGRPRAGRD